MPPSRTTEEQLAADRRQGEAFRRDSDRRLIERLVHEQESARAAASRVQATIDCLLDPHVTLVAVRDQSGHIEDFEYTDANEAACRYDRMSRDELVGSRLLDLLPGHRDSGLFEAYRRVVETSEPLKLDDFAYRHELHGGGLRYFDIRAVRLGDGLAYTWRDVTDRVSARIIAQSEQRYRLLAEASTEVVLHIGDNTVIHWISPSVERELGWAPDEVIGQQMREFVHPDDMERMTAEFAQFRHGEAPRTDGMWVSHFRVRARDGSHHWIESRARPFISVEGEVEGDAVSFRIIDEQVRAEEELRRRARIDDLTGAAKRGAALARLEAASADRRSGGAERGVLFIDIDDLRSFNDRLGHQVGNEILVGVVNRIRDCVRTSDLVARMGGDEFIVLVDGLPTPDDARCVAEKIRSVVAQPLPTSAGEVDVTVSIGVARPDGSPVGDLITQADTAMLAAQETGRDQVIVIPAPGRD